MKKLLIIILIATMAVSCTSQKKFQTWKDGKHSQPHNKNVKCAAYD